MAPRVLMSQIQRRNVGENKRGDDNGVDTAHKLSQVAVLLATDTSSIHEETHESWQFPTRVLYWKSILRRLFLLHCLITYHIHTHVCALAHTYDYMIHLSHLTNRENKADGEQGLFRNTKRMVMRQSVDAVLVLPPPTLIAPREP